MDVKTPVLDCHLFICTNQREAGESCSQKGSMELFQKVKDAVKSDPELREKAKVSKCGCLGFCSLGIAAVHYPEGKWITELKATDADKLLEEIRRRTQKTS
jgi:(2Fe-2S) ferredoxin